MKNHVKWWLRRYMFLLIVWAAALVPMQLFALFFGVPLGVYLHFGGEVAWQIPPLEHIFQYWLIPLTGGLTIATGFVTYEWYLNTFGNPIKKTIYAILFCGLVGVFNFGVLIPWGREMVPHLVNWWHGL